MSYGKVHEEFWIDEKMSAASDAAKLLALYLISGPHRNAIGCFRVPAPYIVADLRWPERKVIAALAELREMGFITRDDSSGWTLINNLLRYDPIKGDKAAIGAARLAAIVPKGLAVYEALYERLHPVIASEIKGDQWGIEPPSKGDTKPLRSPEPSPEPLPEPSPEPEPEPEHAMRADARQTPKATRLPDDWIPGEPLTRWCEADLPGFDWQRETEIFRDYWKAAVGAKGRKQDWPAVWRNWMRRAADGFGKTNGAGNGKPGQPRPDQTALRRAGIVNALAEFEREHR